MTIFFRSATVVASFWVASAGALSAFAQHSAAGTNVVVLDVGKVFKEHVRFKQAMDVMKKDVEAFEDYLRQKRNEVQKMADDLRNYKNGTPEYNNLEAEITKQTSSLQVDTQLKRKDFMQREAKLYYNTYTEVTTAVDRFAGQYGIQLVLRYNSEPIKADDRASVLAGVNANVVYQKNRDITNRIIEDLNRGSAVGRNPGGPPIPR